MPYQFTTAEQAQIHAAQALCPQGSVATTTGNWVPFYTALSNILTQRIGDGSASGRDLQDMRNAKLWLDVAIGANGVTGMHSAFIRTYTNMQGEMRRGSPFTPLEMQKASNGVALNLWDNLRDSSNGKIPWQVPSISTIARADASSIGDYLFGPLSTQPLPSGDTAVDANAAWSGALGFNLLGGTSPYESWRLLTGGDGASNTGSSANRYDDFKNLLFAVHAYEKALKAGYAQSGADFVNFFAASQYAASTGQWPADNAGPLAAQVAVVFASGNVFGLVKDVAARTPGISPIVNSIANMGVNRFLDMLMGAKVGISKLGTTTDANFAATAKNFFSALTPAELGSLNAQLLPTSPSAIVALAQSDVNARAALVAGSFVSVQVSTTVANSAALLLHDPVTGQGTLTKQWLEDRSYFVTALGTGKPDIASQLWRSNSLPANRSFEFRYIDANGAEQIILAENTARPAGTMVNVPSQLVYFGSDAANTLSGSPNALGDHLYAGAGSDTLDGMGGNDYLEGGQGNDHYAFNAAFGNDTVLDSDGQGSIKIGTITLSGGNKLSDNLWESDDKKTVYLQQGTDLLIGQRPVAGASTVVGTITVKNWSSGQLGINLQNTVIPAVPGTLYNGDQHALLDNNGNYNWAATGWAPDGSLTNGVAEANFNDVIYGTLDDEVLNGFGGNDALDGGAGNDEINGGAGDDLIAGRSGSDIIEGGDGNDFIVSNSYMITPQRTAPTDTVPPVAGITVLIQGSNWSVYVQDNAIEWPGYIGVDQASDAPDIVDAGDGNDYAFGGGGGDFIVGGKGADVIQGRGGADVIDGGEGNDSILGDASASSGVAPELNGADFIDGGAGVDVIYGMGGADEIYGGSGDDLLFGDIAEGYLSGAFHGADYLDGEEGDDLMVGGGAGDILYGGSGGDTMYGDGRTPEDVAAQWEGDDFLDGGDGNDYLYGGFGADTLVGGAGDDVLFGGGGYDVFHGGTGNDSIAVGGTANATILFGRGDGYDTLNRYGIDETGQAAPLTGSSTLQFSSGITAADLGVWSVGTSLWIGIKGTSDRVIVNNYFASAPTGASIAQGSTAASLTSETNSLSIAAYTPVQLFKFDDGTSWEVPIATLGSIVLAPSFGPYYFGTDYDDIFYGDSQSSIFEGRGGNDEIYAGDGADSVRGEDGDDLLYGGAWTDDVFGGAGNDIMYGEDGDDRIFGGDGDDLIDGGAGNDLAYGGGGSDTYVFRRGSGNDVYENERAADSVEVDTLQFIDINPGDVQVSWDSNFWYQAPENLRLTVVGTNDSVVLRRYSRLPIGTAGNPDYLSYEIDQITFADGAVWHSANFSSHISADNLTRIGTADYDTLVGGSGLDILQGFAGNDSLSGGFGADTMIGGADNDTYYVDSANDVVEELIGEGHDTVIAFVDFTLPENVEDLNVPQWGTYPVIAPNLKLTGNSLNNTIYGEYGDNVLDGRGGADTMLGGDGNDVYHVDNAGDSITENAGEGIDTVLSSVSRSLGSNFENLTLTGTSAINATGNSLANVLTGNSAANTLTGGAGDDLYRYNSGGAADRVIDSAGNDRIVFGSGITQAQITATRTGSIVKLIVNGTDSISIDDLGGGAYAVEEFEFADGAVLGAVWVNSIIINAAPTATSLSAAESYTEDTAKNLVDIVVTDADSANVIVTLTLSNVAAGSLNVGTSGAVTSTFVAGTGVWTASGAKANVNTLLAALTFTPATNFNGNFSIATSISDGIAPAVTGSKAFTGTAVNDAPTGAVTIAGTAAQGQTLTAANTLADVDGLGTIAYQWRAAGIAISGATASTFLLTSAQVGQAITVSASYIDGKGTVESVGSSATALVAATANAAPTATNLSAAEAYTEDTAKNLVDIVVTDADSANVTVTLTLSNVVAGSLNVGTSGTVTSTYNAATGVWIANGAKANVNTLLAGLTFTPAANFNGNFSIATSVSDGIAPAITGSKAFTGTAVNDLPTGTVTISGTAIQGQTLTAAPTLADVDGLGSIAYQWRAAGVAISGATASSFLLTPAQVGQAITVSASYTDGKGTAESVGSAATATVVASSGGTTGTAGADTISGTAGADQMSGLAGNDTYVVNNTGDLVIENINEGTDLVNASISYSLVANVENLTLTGTAASGTGNALANVITGNASANTLSGGIGNDTLIGAAGSDVMLGGDGDDTFQLTGTDAGSDSFQGDAGADQVLGSAGDDIIRLSRFWGNYTVEKIDGSTGVNIITTHATTGTDLNFSATQLLSIASIQGGAGNDSIAGSATADVIVGGAGSDLLTGGAGDDTFQISGTDAGSDIFQGDAGADQVLGGAGDDTIRLSRFWGNYTVEKIDGGTGINVIAAHGTTATELNFSATQLLNIARIEGGAGNDSITGGAGADVLKGLAGSDRLTGGLGNDTYWLARGYGLDTITENDATVGNTDIARFDTGIATDQLWFTKVGNNLDVSIIGTTDKFTLTNWYLGNQYHVEQFKTSDGKTLLDSQVQNLVSAMAGFAPPAAGQTTLPANYATTLAPVFAANWV